MMSLRSLPWSKLVLGAAVVALIVASMFARFRATTDASDHSLAVLNDLDPLTGSILIDLDDWSSTSDREDVAAQLARAIAPHSWPTSEAGLGVQLDDNSELWRITPPASELQDVLDFLNNFSGVEYAEAERTWTIPDMPQGYALGEGDQTPTPFAPNDPYYKYQWHMGQIGMPDAWNRERGEGIIVAVIDTGVAYRTGGRFVQAPDLAQTRFVDGWDFVDNDAFPDDEHGHGTHCAGTVAQSTDNGLGVTGVAPEATIMPIRVLDHNGSGSFGSITAGIRWAADHGAHVISMSLGGGMHSKATQEAINYAHSKGVVVIAAAGNDNRSTVSYPAAYNHVIAVGAVRFDRTRSFYSSYGAGLDIVAPGGDTRVDQNGDGQTDGVVQNTLVGGNPTQFDYVGYQGTSMATPHVAGVAALLMASGITDPDAVERQLLQSALNVGNRHEYGGGLLQAHAALTQATDNAGGTRGVFAVILGLCVLEALRRKSKLGVGIAVTLVVAFIVAGGLGLLPLSYLGLARLDTILSWGGPGLGAQLGGQWLAPLALSALVPCAAVLFLLQLSKARPFLVGLCMGTAAFLMLEAFFPTIALALPDGAAGPWLVANSIFLLYLGHQVAADQRV